MTRDFNWVTFGFYDASFFNMSLDINSVTSSSHLKDRLHAAKHFLIEYPAETQATAARIFKLNPKTLNNSIVRLSGRHGGQNKVLTESQERAVHTFIRSYITHDQKPTRAIVLSTITHVRVKDGQSRPSDSWFTKWWKGQPALHKITTKPLPRVRIKAQDRQVIMDWFVAYREVLDKYQFQAKDIYNFDETGF